SVVDEDPLCSRPGEDPDRRGTTHRADHRAHDLSPGTVAPGVDDATPRVGPLQPQPQRAVRGTVEPGTETLEVVDGPRRCVGDLRHDIRVAEPGAGRDGVSSVERRRVVTPD